MKGIVNNKPKKKDRHILSSIFQYFRTMYSNQACIDRGTGISTLTNEKVGIKKTWYIAVIFFIVAMLMALTPIAVHASQQNASLIAFSTYNHNYDEYIYSATLKTSDYHSVDGDLSDLTLNDNKVSGEFTTNNDFVIDSTGELVEFNYIGYHLSLNSEEEGYVKDFEIFYASDENATKLINDFNLAENTFRYNSATSDVDFESKDAVIDRDYSFIMFSESTFYIYIFNGQNLRGDYLSFTENNVTIESLLSRNVIESDDRNVKVNTVFNNFKSFLDISYKHNLVRGTWIQVGITVGVNAGITLILGLILFLMTRGKNNPNRIIKWYQCFLIAFYASLCPGLLTLIFGFILSGMEIMLYVLTFGVRVMWMSVRNLRPAYQ